MANDILQIIIIIILGLSIIVMWARDLKNNTSIKRDNGLLFDIIVTLLDLELILTIISK